MWSPTPRFFLVAALDAPAGQLLESIDQLDDRGGVLPAATQVVDLARPGIGVKGFERPDDVFAVDLVPDLLSLVPDDGIRLPLDGHANEVREESVKLHRAVEWAGQAAAAKNTGLYPEITAVLLRQNIAGKLAGSKETVQAAIDAAGLVDAVPIRRLGVIEPGGKLEAAARWGRRRTPCSCSSG
jgi:hypothetical protein